MMETGKQVIFRQLLEDHDTIQIPIIQRDYAQGRESAEDIRNDFLIALKGALERPPMDSDLPLNLDFVYGSVETAFGESRFAPLDGQQRLTTLFLMQWYFAWQDECWDDFAALFGIDGHSKFTYRVRPSSSDFFDFLVNFRPESPPCEVDNLSALIKDQPQYFRNWRLDPTISAILVMLESIHNLFRESVGLYGRITSVENPAITFQLLDLKQFDLSDDLYIKMNARGVPLTPFETFKARYVQTLESNFPATQRSIDGHEFPIHEFVARRLDTTWMDLFWATSTDRFNRSAVVDNSMFNLFRVVAILTRDLETDILPDVKLLRRLKPTYAMFHDRDWLDERFTATLIPLLETWCRAEDGFQPILPSSNYFNERAFFTKITNESRGLEVPEILQLFGYVLFIKQHEGDFCSERFENWMRVVHNLVINSNIDREERLQGGMLGILRLSGQSNDILEHLASLPSFEGLGSFPDRQIAEEQVKAGLVLHHSGWQELISRAEHHGYFRGQIEFLLDFCGVLKESQNTHINSWSESKHEEFQKLFRDYLLKSEAMFNGSGVDNSEFRWHRALLAVGNYLFPMSSHRTSMLVDAATEVTSWKRLLRGYQEHEAQGRHLLKSLWDRLDPRSPYRPQLEAIIRTAIEEEILEPWRAALVGSPTAIKYCGTRTIRKESDQRIYLLSKSQMNSSHAELFTYKLFCDELLPRQNQNEFAPLHLDLDYEFSKDKETEPGFNFYWREAGEQLEVKVEFTESQYQISMDLAEVPEEVKSILRDEAGFSVDTSALRLLRLADENEFMECIRTIQNALTAVKPVD